MTIDARLRLAVDGNVGWYEAIFGLHGIGSAIADSLWSALGPHRRSTRTRWCLSRVR